jgi:hypothetical protein
MPITTINTETVYQTLDTPMSAQYLTRYGAITLISGSDKLYLRPRMNTECMEVTKYTASEMVEKLMELQSESPRFIQDIFDKFSPQEREFVKSGIYFTFGDY